MTVTQLVEESGLNLTRSQRAKLGNVIKTKADSQGVVYAKTFESILVNDYPESFTKEAQDILIDFIQNQNG